MGSRGKQIRLVLADDHAVVRTGLRVLLEGEPDFEVVAEAGDLTETVRYMRVHGPDVLVLDLNMPGEPSLPAIPALREEFADTQIVVLTMYNDPVFAKETLRAGAMGYVLKAAASSELVKAVRLAASGKSYVQPELGAYLPEDRQAGEGPPDGLTRREVDVLRLIALGHTNAEIAGELVLSVRTVESHRSHIQRKLDRSSRADLVRYAFQHGLIESSPYA